MVISSDPSQSFLDQVVAYISVDKEISLDAQCWVVPTRRAAVFLRDSLVRTQRQTLWAPEILSIQDFIRKWMPWQFPEPLRLVFELYEVYLPHLDSQDRQESFEHFYSWGEMLLRDFDEVDKYMVDASQLFANIRDVKEIETRFHLPEENQKSINQFWYTIYPKEDSTPTELQEKFLKIWGKLHEIYSAFQKSLKGKGLAYDGMAYRAIVEQLEADTLTFPYEKIQFIGFNALSHSEERIMNYLLTHKKAQVYWDADKSYVKTGDVTRTLLSSEPSKFIEAYHQKWKDKGSVLFLHDMAAEPKEIFLTGVALPSGQAHYLGTLLHEQLPKDTQLRNHAVVLADEHLLFPSLYKLPPQVDRLNITMGYPLRETPVYHLIASLSGLLRNMRRQGEAWGFAYQDVLNILSNSYVQSIAARELRKLREHIREKNLLYVTQDIIKEFELPSLILDLFNPPNHPSKSNEYFLSIFDVLIEDAQERGARLEGEYIFQLYTNFNRFREILLQYKTELSFYGYTRLLREALNKARIPFQGEPLAGLQVMGFLETRVLDFENLYVLGANEGNLPDTQTGNSFIPYPLRKGFKLPTYEEKDTIYSYHFFRLIQRAKKVHVIYNTLGKDEGGSGEPSRYIEQIRFYLGEEVLKHTQIKVSENKILTPVPYLAPQPIEILNTQETRRLLLRKYAQKDDGTLNKAYISATALTTYLACPLRFYFRYVAGIKEGNVVEEQMEAGTFGSILHHTLEYIYRGIGSGGIGNEEMRNKELAKGISNRSPKAPRRGDRGGLLITEDKLPSLKSLIEPSLKKAFAVHELDWDHTEGVNFLFRDALGELCQSILEHDVSGSPFQVVYMEEEKKFDTFLPIGTQALYLNGTFDRVDWLPEQRIIRIVDYKTGRAKIKSGLDMETLFANADYKEMVQGYFYAWLYQRRFPTARIQMAFYPLREIQKGRAYLNGGEILSPELLQEFEGQMVNVLQEIFSLPYTQVEDEKVCTYCPYKGICGRG
ncbi:MAG: PD-(D/E)XK nuclease family protein [Bacteroidota bacterium]